MLRFLPVLVCLIMLSCQTKAPEVAQTSAIQPKKQTTLKYEIQSFNSAGKAPLLVLLHGYGDNALNFSAIGRLFDKRLAKATIYAPHDYGNNRFGWYNIDFTTPEKQGNLEEAEMTRQQILTTIDEMIQKHGIDSKQVYLLGFSQGTIMSLDIALSAPEKVKGLLLYSGKLLRDLDTRIVEKDRLKK